MKSTGVICLLFRSKEKTVLTFQIPVYKGCSKAIIKHEGLVSDYHGNDGFCDYPFETMVDLNLLQSEHATTKLMQLSKEFEGKLNCFYSLHR